MDFPYGNVLCEARYAVWLECEEFCSTSVDRPQINTEGEGGQSTANSERLMSVGGEGGEGGQLTANLESLTSVGGEGGEGGSIDSQLREVDICRWGGRGGRVNRQPTQRG